MIVPNAGHWARRSNRVEANMPLPNMFVIGAIKAGTTSLYRYLGQHPQIFMSAAKEPGWFADDFYDAQRNDTGTVITRAEYEQLFAGSDGFAVVGEASPQYLCSSVAPQKIKTMTPDARLIAVLRDPAERALSAYVHLRREGFEPCEDLREGLAAEPARIAEGRNPIWYYRTAGRYLEQITRYRELFGPDQLWIGLYDDFERDPTEFTQQLYRFLGVDSDFTPDTSLRFNPSGIPRSKRAFAALTTDNTLRRVASRAVPGRLRESVRVKLINRVLVKPELDGRDRADLVEGYRGGIERLGELLDRDLSAWLR